MSRRTFRRFNPNVPIVRGSRRPTDKELIFLSQNATTSNTQTTLKTATFPCTIVGVRWDFTVTGLVTTGNPTTSWIIVIIKDGNSANTISQSNGADMYTPEANVMAFGTATNLDTDATAGNTVMHITGQTKTMRKMQQGDILAFVTLCSIVTGANVKGVVQFFCKS